MAKIIAFPMTDADRLRARIPNIRNRRMYDAWSQDYRRAKAKLSEQERIDLACRAALRITSLERGAA